MKRNKIIFTNPESIFSICNDTLLNYIKTHSFENKRYILQSGNGTTWSPAYNGEYRAVWAHLKQAGLMNDGVNYMYEDGGAINIPTFDGATPNFPKLDWSKNSGIVVVASINGENHGIYRLANFTNAPAGNYAATGVEDIFTPEQALSIDVKMDDGLNLYSGIVYGGDGLGPRYSDLNPAQYPDTHPENDCFNTSFVVDSGYGTSMNVVDCHLLIKYLPNER
jgi:hypothetical protein